MGHHKLRHKDLAGYRKRLLREQKGVCLLCNKKILKDPVLDHCHSTGKIRGVLHRQCNSSEGRVSRWASRCGINRDQFLINLLRYWSKTFHQNPLHPKHLTAYDKEVRLCKKKIRSLKTEVGKMRWKVRLQELEDK